MAGNGRGEGEASSGRTSGGRDADATGDKAAGGTGADASGGGTSGGTGLRARARTALWYARVLWSLRPLPARVAIFYARAVWTARSADDRFSLDSAARPHELATLLELASGRSRVAELGTGTAWSTIALALAEPTRHVVSFDPVTRGEREHYLSLLRPGERERIRLEQRSGEVAAAGESDIDFLFVDSSHEREPTLAEFAAWRPRLAPGAIIAFHDYRHPGYPGVTEAIEELGLEGEAHGNVFAWRAPGA